MMLTFLIAINCIIQIKVDVITVDIVRYYFERPLIIVKFPNENKEDKVFLNTRLSFSTFKYQDEEYINNHIIKNETICLDKNYDSVLYRTNVSLMTDIMINDLSMYIIPNGANMYYIDKGLALGYHIEEEFSIVHQLYKNKKIDHLKFAFHNIRDTAKSSHFFIGGIPNEEHLTLPYKGVIKVDESLPSWGFNVDKVVFNNTEYDLNVKAVISSTSQYMIISDDLFILLRKKVLKKYYDKDICYIKTDEDEYNQRGIECIEKINISDTYSFIMNGVKIDFKSNILFNQLNYNFHSNGQGELKVNNFTGIILGPFFLSQFNYTLFDYENKQIEFYSDSITIESLYKVNKAILPLLCIISILLIFDSLHLIYYKSKLT